MRPGCDTTSSCPFTKVVRKFIRISITNVTSTIMRERTTNSNIHLYLANFNVPKLKKRVIMS